ncbi:hypothetical protein GCM10027059_37900 [Myceligenerans halotolerans]
MVLDAARYRTDYLEPQARRKDKRLDDDLLARYAIKLPSSDVEIAARLKEVRAVWQSNGGAVNGTPVAQFCRKCRIADEKLQDEHGSAMLKAEWWQKQVDLHGNAASAAADELVKVLRAHYGDLGVVTRGALERAATPDGLGPQRAATAATAAGLAVVDAVRLPQDPPFAQYKSFANALDLAQDPSVVHLVHPDVGSFRILSRFEALSGRALELTESAVSARSKDADSMPTTSLWDARRDALTLLRTAVRSGADLRQTALYHLVQKVREDAAVSPGRARDRLIGAGLDPLEAVVLAVSLADQLASGETRTSAGQVLELLASGRLREANRVAQALTGTTVNRAALKRLKEAKAEAEGLVARVRELLAAGDEAAAAVAVRDVADVSVDDADELLTTVPLLPPRDLRLGVDGSAVRLHWQPGVGHDDVRYVVCRDPGSAPPTPAHGKRVGEDHATSGLDPEPPAGRKAFYSVFAVQQGRPSSRPVTGSVMVLPPVRDLRADVGASSVVVHWSIDPAAVAVRAMRHDPGTAPVMLPVRSDSVRLNGLREGETVRIEVTAVYRDADGREVHAPTSGIDATPRSEAAPVTTLRARTVTRGDQPRVLLVWRTTDRSPVRFRYAATPPRWAEGAVVSADDLARFGADVAGATETVRGEASLEAGLPAGVHHIVPFSTGGTGIVVGRPATVGVVDPVRDLTVTVFADHLRAAWTWPAGAASAEVVVDSEGESDLVRCTRAEYDDHGGVRVPLGIGLTDVTVRPIVQVGQKAHLGPPVVRTVDSGGGAEVRYQVASSPSLGRWGGRSKEVTFTAPRDCSGVRVVMVASRGVVKPLTVDDGVPILDRRLDLRAGVPHVESVRVPAGFSRPYWVLCFITEGNARLVDPPTSFLKES